MIILLCAKNMKKLLVIIVIVMCFFALFSYKDFRLRCEYFNCSFEGVILALKYTNQKTVVFKTESKEEWIYLGTEVKYELPIETGDTLIKRSKDYNVYLVKDGIVHNIRSDRNFEKWAKYCNCK